MAPKQFFYNKTENDVKYIAVDGSWLNVCTHLKFDYKKSKDGNYKKILLSCLFDVYNIPILKLKWRYLKSVYLL